ncbi:MAG: hypothetical protein ACFCUU_15120 [Cyclobacteriaceae bacterium]
MKSLLRSSFIFLLFIFSLDCFAQSEPTIHITLNGKTQNLENYIEDLANNLGQKLEKAFEGNCNLSFDFSSDDVVVKLNANSYSISNMADRLATAIESALTHMEIEIRDIEVSELEHGDFSINNKDQVYNMIEKVEKRHKSKVKKVDKLIMKFEQEFIDVRMDVTLENGKSIRNLKEKIEK